MGPRSRRIARRTVQGLFVVGVLWFGARLVAQHWEGLRALRATLTPDWTRIALSGVIVLASYAMLIATWRAMLRAWGSALGARDGARIWFVSNLGRYLPGKIWQIGAMGVMAHEVGVPPEAAVGSSVVIALVNILAGFAVAAAAGAAAGGAANGAANGAAFALLGADGATLWLPLVALLVVTASLPWTLAPLIGVAARISGRAIVAPRLPAGAIWTAAGGCGIAWVLYGLAFRELSAGLLAPATAGDAGAYVAVFTLSYLAGFLALFAPGGIGVREVSMGALLVGSGLATGAEATLLVLASRLWLTLLEIVPGLFFLAWPRPRPPISAAPPS